MNKLNLIMFRKITYFDQVRFILIMQDWLNLKAIIFCNMIRRLL